MSVVRLYPYRVSARPTVLRVGRPGEPQRPAPITIGAENDDVVLELEVRLPDDAGSLVPAGVGSDILRPIVRVSSRDSQSREPVSLEPDDGRWTGTVKLARHRWFGRVELEAVVVLDRDIERVAGHASVAGSVVARSDAVTVVFDELRSTAQGRTLTVEWISFSDGNEWVRTHADQLFALQPSDPPILWLNTDVPGSYALLSARGTRGPRARLRDAVFVQIAHQVWTSLLTVAFTRLGDTAAASGAVSEPADLLADLSGWYGEALEEWLSDLYLGDPLETAVDRLVDDVRSPLSDELLLQRVPSAVQRFVGSAPKFAGMLKEQRLLHGPDGG